MWSLVPDSASRRRCRCRATAKKCGDRSSAVMRASGNALRRSRVESPARQGPQS